MLIQEGHFQKCDSGIFSKSTGRQQAVQDTLYDQGSDSIQSPPPPSPPERPLKCYLSYCHMLYLQEPHRAITADFSQYYLWKVF